MAVVHVLFVAAPLPFLAVIHFNIASHCSYLTLLEFDMIGQQISLAKSRSTRSLEC